MKTVISLLIILISLNAFSAETSLERIEPMFWWAGMKSPELQLMVHGEIHSISKTLDAETRITIKLRSRVLIPPNKIDEIFPL